LDQHKKVILLLTSNNDGSEMNKQINSQIIKLMDPCLKELQSLKKEREEAIEEYFEEAAEEKMEQVVDVKRKYKTIFAMLEKSKAATKEEKIEKQKAKMAAEIADIQEEIEG
jgi:hypothetical protein